MRFQVKYDKNKSLEDSVYETKQQLYKEHKLQALFFEVTSRKRKKILDRQITF